MVLDAVAGPFFEPAYRRMRPAGRMVIYGAADLMPSGARTNWLKLAVRYLTRPRINPIRMVSANKSVMGFNLIWLWEQADRLPQAYAGLAPHITRPPHIGRQFAFAEAPAALRYLQGGGSLGKVVSRSEASHHQRLEIRHALLGERPVLLHVVALDPDALAAVNVFTQSMLPLQAPPAAAEPGGRRGRRRHRGVHVDVLQVHRVEAPGYFGSTRRRQDRR